MRLAEGSALAESLRLETVAEGVETPEQAEALIAQGCTRLQGYLFSRPVPASVLPGTAAALRDRLLMADAIFQWWVTGQWAYNHGKRGGRAYGNGPATPYEMVGNNQLYGDGHVEWKIANRAELQDMMNPSSTTSPRIALYGSPYPDRTFYLR